MNLRRLCFVLSIASTCLYAQFDFNPFGNDQYNLHPFEPEINDARGEALGRTSILSSQGSNFIFNNPALLSTLTKKNFQISGRLVSGSTQDEYEQEYEYEDLYYSYSDYEYYKTEGESDFPFRAGFNGASFAMPFTLSGNKDIVYGIGAGYRVYIDNGFDKDDSFEESYIYFKQASPEPYEVSSESDGGLTVLVFGGGLNYQKKLSVGLSLSTSFYSELTTESKAEIDSMSASSKAEIESDATFFTLSCAYILNDQITLGARIRTGFETDNDVKLTENSEFYEDTEEFDYEVDIPSEIALAVEYKPLDDLKIYAEYITRGLGDYELGFFGMKMDIYEESDNGFSLRTGIEYGNKLILRGGFFMQSVPVYEAESIDFDYGDVVYAEEPMTEFGFTGGLGLNLLSDLTIDIFGSYSFLDCCYSVEDEYEDAYEIYSVKETRDFESQRMKFGCTIGYSFGIVESGITE
jgi:hypothetical protein